MRPARAALRRLQAKLRALGPANVLASNELVMERRAEAAQEAEGGPAVEAGPTVDKEAGRA